MDKIIIGVLAFIVTAIVEKTVAKNRCHRLCAMLPFVVGIAISLVFHALLAENATFGEVFKEGVSCGCVGVVLRSFIKDVIRGRSNYEDVPFSSLVLEGMLSGYVEEGALKAVAEECADILLAEADTDKAIDAVYRKLVQDYGLTESDAELLAKTAANVLIASQD